ncbi:MAG: hypothetical protein DWQ07_06565 [Chloroflexi bacterium]|nr:MAG: hypothetical protein DWQ07_06565 [Chloroflexota bacterium]MBL1195907.1 hypothetical protein [Chloroflexota bacterium]NOH13200.1 hypothetical protein [Chloroflexota bacterium]
MYRSKLIGALLLFALVLAACGGSPLSLLPSFDLDQLQDEVAQEALQDLTPEQQQCVEEILAGTDPANLPPDWYLACFEIEVPDLAEVAGWTAAELAAFLSEFPQETVDACTAASVTGTPEEIVACVLAASGIEVPQEIQDIIEDPEAALEDLLPPLPDLADIANWTEAELDAFLAQFPQDVVDACKAASTTGDALEIVECVLGLNGVPVPAIPDLADIENWTQQELDAFLGQFPQDVVDACRAATTSADPVDIVTCVLGANGVDVPDLSNIANWSQQELDAFLAQFPQDVVDACRAATTSGDTVDIVECVLGANGIPIPDPADIAIWTAQELEAFLNQFPQELVNACLGSVTSGDTAEIVACVLAAGEIDIPEEIITDPEGALEDILDDLPDPNDLIPPGLPFP